MQYRRLILICSLSTLVGCGEGGDGKFMGDNGVQHSILSVENDRINLGAMRPGAVVPVKFKVSNAGNVPLKIIDLVESCGCSPAESEKDVLLPGESSTISLAFSAGQTVGERSHSVVVETDSLESPKVLLWASADVNWPIVCSPTSLHFANSRVDQPVSRKLEIICSGGSTITPENVSVVSGPLSLKCSQVNKGHIECNVMAIPTKPGQFSGEILVRTASLERPEIRVRCTGIAFGDGTLEPSVFWIGTLSSMSKVAVRWSIKGHKWRGSGNYQVTFEEGAQLQLHDINIDFEDGTLVALMAIGIADGVHRKLAPRRSARIDENFTINVRESGGQFVPLASGRVLARIK